MRVKVRKTVYSVPGSYHVSLGQPELIGSHVSASQELGLGLCTERLFKVDWSKKVSQR